MSRFFRIVAIAIMAISAFFTVISIATIVDQGAIIILIASLLGVMLGLALYTIGDLLDRVKSLEEKLDRTK